MLWNWIPSLLSLIFSESEQGSNERRLLHYLFEETYYNPLERPIENESLPIVVHFSLILQQIIDVVSKMFTNSSSSS